MIIKTEVLSKQASKAISSYNLTDEMISQLKVFHDMIIAENKKINLMSRGDQDIMWHRHISDSLQLARFLTPLTEPNSKIINQKSIKSSQLDQSDKSKQLNLLDLGSGAGFPAIPLAIMRKDIEIYMLEATKKKANFLADVSRETNLNNASVINSRLEDFTSGKFIEQLENKPNKIEENDPEAKLKDQSLEHQNQNLILKLKPNLKTNTKFDFITARAFGTTVSVLKLCEKVANKQTSYILPKGCNYQQELAKLEDYITEKKLKLKVELAKSQTDPSSKIIIISTD